MRVITWNVNGIKPRLERLLALLDREQPDVVLLQEIKCVDDAFPTMELAAQGYEVLAHGQRTYNGVAILSRAPLEPLASAVTDDPVPGEARMLAARAGDVNVASVYVINGREVGHPAYEAKLAWLRGLRTWIEATFDPSDPLIVAGDFNIAPDDRDVWDPDLWREQCHFTDAEHEALGALMGWGFADLFRLHEAEGGHFSWWDYRGGNFHKRLGLRIDLILGTESLAERCTEVRIDRNERKPTAGPGAPSDHAPVIATFSD